ncbi:hypothetical protein TWF694_010161 [Orbilia ellipsospora]|uniref:Uncharacterized protein n=1 Tax=Orbilia ellipsospora TaxID=2528407 RepID=A0AAV9X918_9PEZI
MKNLQLSRILFQIPNWSYHSFKIKFDPFWFLASTSSINVFNGDKTKSLQERMDPADAKVTTAYLSILETVTVTEFINVFTSTDISNQDTATSVLVMPSPIQFSHPKTHKNLAIGLQGIIDPGSPYFTSLAVNETMKLTNAIFSHTAIITWIVLFGAFLTVAGVVFGIQKIMNRIRAKRWAAKHAIEDQKEEEGEREVIGDSTMDSGHSIGSTTCEFINGNDLVSQTEREKEGVDPRGGFWSRRRDKRMENGGRRRRSPIKAKLGSEVV